MIYKKLQNLFSHYLYKDNSKEELEAFRNQYEMIFDTFRDELIDETELIQRIKSIYESSLSHR